MTLPLARRIRWCVQLVKALFAPSPSHDERVAGTRFRCAFLLATRLNSLALASRSTMRHCSHLAVFISFAPHLIVTAQFQALFTALSGCFSVFPHGTRYAIGLGVCLALEVNAPTFPRPIQSTVLRIPPHPARVRLHGYHVLWQGFPALFGSADRVKRWS